MTLVRNTSHEGSLRRLIDLQRWDEHAVVGWVEDDFHHFGETIKHAEGHMRAVRAAPAGTNAGIVLMRKIAGNDLDP